MVVSLHMIINLLIITNVLYSYVQGAQNVTNVLPDLAPVAKDLTNNTVKLEAKIFTNVSIDIVPKPKNNTSTTVPGSFAESKIVPEIIPDSPEGLVEVTFQNGLKVSLGNELTPTQVQEMPHVTWNASFDQYYTLIAIDPDLPSRMNPILREWRHWCVVNIPGNNVTGGDTIVEYISAGPPANSGLHRFIFLIYLQPGVIFFNVTRQNNTSVADRDGFSTIRFAEKYNLGSPKAGNFYYTSYDSYVPVLYNKLGFRYRNAAATPLVLQKGIIAALITAFYWILFV